MKHRTENTPQKQNATSETMRKQRTNLRLFRLAVGIPNTVLCFLVFFQLLFRYYTDEIVGHALKEVVALKSDGLYQMVYDDIQLNFIGNHIKISNLSLQPSEKVFRQLKKNNKSVNKLYEFEIKNIYLKGFNFRKLYFEKKLKIKQFEITDIHLRIKGDRHTTADSKDDAFRMSNLYFLISGYLKEFRIANFDMKNASFVYRHYPEGVGKGTAENLYYLKNIRIHANSFSIDSLSSPNYPFALNDLQVYLGKNAVRFRNNTTISVDSLEIGTKAGFLCTQNLKITPGKKPATSFFCPALRITGLDYPKAYLVRTLRLDSLCLNQPVFRSRGKTRQNYLQKRKIAPDLYRLLSKYFYALKINTVKADTAQILLGKKLNLKNVSLKFKNLIIDSISHQKRRPLFYSDTLEFNIADFKHLLPDSSHTLSWSRLFYTIPSNALSVEKLRIKHRKKTTALPRRKKSKPIFAVNVPKLRASGLDLPQILAQQKVILNALHLYKPSVKVFSTKKTHTPSAQPPLSAQTLNPENLYPLLKNRLKLLKIGQLTIHKGKADWTQKVPPNQFLEAGASNIGLTLKDFEIAPHTYADTNRLLQSRNVRLRFEDAYLILPDSLHQIRLGKAAFASADSLFALTNLQLVPKYTGKALTQTNTQNTFFQAHIPKISFHSAALRNILYTQSGNLGQIKADKPQINIYKASKNIPKSSKKTVKSTSIPLLFAKNIMLDSGTVNFFIYGKDTLRQVMHLSEVSTEIGKLALDSVLKNPKQFFSAENFAFRTKNYQILLPDSTHLLSADDFRLDTQKENIYLKNIHIRPRKDVFNFSKKYFIKIPTLALFGVKFKDFSEKQLLKIDTLRSDSSEISAYFWVGKQKNRTKTPNHPPFFALLKKWMTHCSVQNIELKKNRLQLFLKDSAASDFRKIEVENLRLAADSFQYDMNPKKATIPFFAYPGAALHLRTGKVTVQEKKRKSILDSLHFRGNNFAKLSIFGLKFRSSCPFTEKKDLYFGEKPQYDFKSRKLRADSIDLIKLFEEAHFFSSRVLVSHPDLRVSAQSSPKKFRLIAAQEVFKSIFPKVTLRTVVLEDGHFLFNLSGNRSFAPLRVSGFKHLSANCGKLSAPLFHRKKGKTNSAGFFGGKREKYFSDKKKKKNFLPHLPYLTLCFPDYHTLLPQKSRIRISGRGLNGVQQGFTTDSLSATYRRSVLFHEQISYNLSELTVKIPDVFFEISGKNLFFDTQKRHLGLGSLKAAHQLSPQVFFAERGQQSDWASFRTGGILVKDIDFGAIFSKKNLSASVLKIDSLEGVVFRDKHYPFPKYKRVAMPQEFLQQFPFAFRLDSLQLRGGEITYREASSGKKRQKAAVFLNDSLRSGQIQFKDLSVDLAHLSNQTDTATQPAVLEARAMLMGNGLLNIRLVFQPSDPFCAYNFEGELAAMPLPQLNAMLEKVAFLKIRSGEARRLRFWVSANRNYAVGKMRFLYNNLSISLLNKTYKVGIHEYLLSLLANTFLIRRSNSRFFLFHKEGKIYARRDPARSVFNHWAKALLSGVRSSITHGQPKKEARQLIKKWEKENKKNLKKK